MDAHLKSDAVLQITSKYGIISDAYNSPCPAPALVAGVEPEAIVKTVTCPEGTEGDKMNLFQTRDEKRLMISEIEIEGMGKY